MSTVVNRGQLKTRILARFDATGTTYIDNSPGGELEQLIDSKLRALWNLLAETQDSYTKRGPVMLSTAAGVRTIPLPPDFMNLVGLYYVPDNKFQSATNPMYPGLSSRRIIVRRFTASEYGSNAQYFNFGPPPIYYDIDGMNNLLMDPIPTQNNTNVLELWYTPAYSAPANDAETIRFLTPGWEDYIVDSVSAELFLKEESMTQFGACMQRAQMWEEKVRNLADQRDRLNPVRIADTGWTENGSTWGMDYGYWGFYGTW